MEWELGALLFAAMFAVAALYGSVGHGGASGYLMVFALAGLAPASMRPTALILNVAVSLVGTLVFLRAGSLRPRLLLPFLAASVPLAWLGGRLEVGGDAFNLLLACALAFAALRLVLKPAIFSTPLSAPPLPAALACGGGIGLVSGLVGVGGGIFLTPVLILCRWADPKSAAAVSAPFILFNSIAGLVGMGDRTAQVLPGTPWYLLAAVCGGFIGSWWGSRWAPSASLKLSLAGVMCVAAFKLLIV